MSSQTTTLSYGVGGAGNYVRQKSYNDKDLKAPIIQEHIYTTGLEGTGNMGVQSTRHWGRGGAGNKSARGSSEKRPQLSARTSSKKTGRSLKSAVDWAKERLSV